MKRLLIAALLVAMLLTVVAAGARQKQATVSVWGYVGFEPVSRPCSGLSNYVEPCEGCKVWLRWPEPVPGTPGFPMRLDGYMTDEPGHCQVLNVTGYVTCYR